MGFEITGDTGFFGAVAIVVALSAAILIAIFFFSASKAAHDDVAGEDEAGDLEA
jgi:hypothetical protein